MLSTTIFATLLAFAAAAPHYGPSVKTGDICGNGNKVHCCNDQSVTNKVTGGVLSDLDLRKLLASECHPLDVNVLLTKLIPIDNTCRQQSVCCGKQVQNGVVNLGCTPINII